MAAAALRQSAKTTPSRWSSQCWTPNSGQVTEDGSRNPVLVLASKTGSIRTVTSETIPHIAVSRDVSTQLSLEEVSLRPAHLHNPSRALAPPSTHDVLCPTCSRPVPSLLLDAAVQTPLYSVASHDASTHLPLTEFFIGCIFSNEPSDRQGPPLAHCNADSASPPQRADIATLCSPSSASHASDGHEHTTAPRVSPQPPPVRLTLNTCSSGTGATSSVCFYLSNAPTLHVNTTQVETHPVRSATTYKKSASTALAGTHNPVGAVPRARTGPFPKPQALVLPTVKIWAIHT